MQGLGLTIAGNPHIPYESSRHFVPQRGGDKICNSHLRCVMSRLLPRAVRHVTVGATAANVKLAILASQKLIPTPSLKLDERRIVVAQTFDRNVTSETQDGITPVYCMFLHVNFQARRIPST